MVRNLAERDCVLIVEGNRGCVMFVMSPPAYSSIMLYFTKGIVDDDDRKPRPIPKLEAKPALKPAPKSNPLKNPLPQCAGKFQQVLEVLTAHQGQQELWNRSPTGGASSRFCTRPPPPPPSRSGPKAPKGVGGGIGGGGSGRGDPGGGVGRVGWGGVQVGRFGVVVGGGGAGSRYLPLPSL